MTCLRVKLTEYGLQQFIEVEAGILTGYDNKLTRVKVLGQNGARDRFSTAYVTSQHAQVHGFFIRQIEQTVERLLMLGAAIIKTRVPRRLKGFRFDLPVL